MAVFVLDTNVLLSAALTPPSPPGCIVLQLTAVDSPHQLAFSEQTWDELVNVLQRRKFDVYISTDERLVYLRQLESVALWCAPQIGVTDCPDPDDNRILEVALAASAQAVVSGDKDLLVLHPWRGIPILRAAPFLPLHSAAH